MYFITALIPSILLLEWFCPYFKKNLKIEIMLTTIFISMIIGLILKKKDI